MNETHQEIMNKIHWDNMTPPATYIQAIFKTVDKELSKVMLIRKQRQTNFESTFC